MTTSDTLIDKEDIRTLAQLYCRGVDRQDIALLKTLYTEDGWDAHGSHFDGPAKDYIGFLERSLPHMHIGAHHITNHMIEVKGDVANGEVYAIAWHLIPDGKGGLLHDMQSVRYIDQYARVNGAWKFKRRDVTFDMKLRLPADDHGDKPDAEKDISYSALTLPLFARGGPR